MTQCYQEQLGVSVSEINALVEKTTPNAESPVPELSQWLLNGLEFMAAVDAGAEVDDVVGAQRLDQVGVERAFLGF